MSRLPASIHVLERGWLSSNNILLFEGDSAVLVDTGYVSHADQTVALVRSALDGCPLTDIVNTHSHSDHIGGNAAVQRAFGCRITVPAGMHDAVQQWDENALLLSVAKQTGERFSADAKIHPGFERDMGGMHWQALAAPGHDMDALMFFNREHGVLISGDALWREGFGILFADVLGTGDGIGEARRTLDVIARLPVRHVIPGHGAPFVEVDEALAAAYARLRAFEEDGSRMARNAIRGCVTFSLLDMRRMPLADLPGWLDSTPLFRIANQRFLNETPERLADWLVDSLVKAGVARREGEWLVAA
ncbi:MBL fold metallo-hydrolase [Denitromonas ohlonensis]|uniref:MBL fold metallo-hydrolase n=2 Tax=Denitromonas TaxID=139331 RepID=A0A557SLC5_9RHOO|nr:MBL fold metallo-hydrolase [Denitromonas ohlonensis]TVO67861.1 MBL fold metallo-hydrolase [Denitromonas ohlonensis]TVO78236.1 MBL fold metallo-hydrolase [Denitromonas ohlonensis]